MGKKKKVDKIGKSIGVPLSEEELEKLEEVKKWYRAESTSHCIRLMLEDAWKGVKKGHSLEEEVATL